MPTEFNVGNPNCSVNPHQAATSSIHQTQTYDISSSHTNSGNYNSYPSNGIVDGYSQGMLNSRNIYSSTTNVNTINANFADNFESTLWTSDFKLSSDIEKGFKFTDKIETIEISSKDLSPASCCSNIDMLLQQDCFRNLNKDPITKTNENYFCNNVNNSYNNQKFTEYPSCSQNVVPLVPLDKTVKYCSIQKPTQLGYGFNNNDGTSQYVSLGHDVLQIDNNTYNNYESKTVDNRINTCTLPPTDFFLSDVLSFDTVNNIDSRTEDDESDIIVEESDDDDYVDNTEPYCTSYSNCIVCNVNYSPIGNQFYILTKETPLTMSSQKPVLGKLTELVGTILNSYLYLCSQCLGLINTIDHLQVKLNSCKVELNMKVGNKCQSVQEIKDNDPRKQRIGNIRNYGFHCKVCNKTIRVKNLLQSHNNFHRQQRSRFLCEWCGKRYSKYRNLITHKVNHCSEKHRDNLIAAFICKICHKSFRTRSNLKEHTHFCSGNLPLKCKQCDKRFTTTTKLKHHTKLKHDKKFASICSICNIGFVKLSDYKSHMVSHSTHKKFKCTKCEKAYKTLSNLNFHMKFHKNEMPFTCTICSKGFMRKEYLEAHVNLHNGIKNFSCSVCSKKFVSQKNLDAHFKCHDQAVEKKVCNICLKTISTRFEEHLRTHMNLKEFDCDLCDMRFNTKGALSKHKKRKHVNENENSTTNVFK